MSSLRSLLKSLLLTVAFVLVAGASPVTGQQPHRDGSGAITMALTGDAIISRQLSVYAEPEFLALRDLIRSASVGFTNLEVLLHDYEDDVIPATESGGTYMRAAPAMAKELVWMGFDMVSRANNHSLDFGTGGMRHTDRAVEAAGLAHAGTGEKLALARAPGYLHTPQGRVALISLSSTFADHMRAGHQGKDLRGRPGLNPLRYTRTYTLPSEGMEALRTVMSGFGMRGGGSGDRIRFMRNEFRLGDEYSTSMVANQEDVEEILTAVREARRQANWVIISGHTHETGSVTNTPAPFYVEFAKAAIDAGADVVVSQGSHTLRGIEIYQGKPIFYGLGDFMFQPETVERQPVDNYRRYGLSDDAVAADFFDARQARGGFPSR
ncbi:MAG: CapA family protein, partial [Gemmatimonadetes bacterium]|nr:CapA family protein [Gemmatimonadota bacterium]